MSTRRRGAGFTLIELMVALFVLALVAVLSWRGLDGMVRAQETTQARADEIHALQIGLAQWNTDLDALVQLPQMPGLDWNGRVLRLTRPASTAAGGAFACLMAVEMMPVPSGFVRTRASPGRAPTFRQMRPGWTRPVTA